jgi:N-methylhydantoinase A/oxoprolinase/acetone carboxylase beta subunit
MRVTSDIGGYPILVPTIDTVEIGSGGGSIPIIFWEEKYP